MSAVPDTSLRGVWAMPVVAGLVTVLVGFTSSYALVLEALRAMGLDAGGIVTATAALALGMGLTTLLPSLWWKRPVVTAWSTPGAALLATSLVGGTPGEAVAAFVACGLALVVVGLSGRFEALMARVPAALASALLAGILARFGLEAFAALQGAFLLAAPMLAVFVAARRLVPRWAVPLVLVTGVGLALAQGVTLPAWGGWVAPALQPVAPALRWGALLDVALPLFVVTMASQNLPGVAVLRASGYGDVPVSKVVALTGLATVLLAPFGVFALNLAAITAALCMGADAHPDPARRWQAAACAGGFYLAIACFAAPIAQLFTALPRAVIVVVAGLALLPTIARGLQVAMQEESEREPALVAFLVTLSGVSVAGIGSAFWGVVIGLGVRLAWKCRA